MKEGDYYRWSYKDTTGNPYPYHCTSRIGVVRGDRLIDTYWNSLSYGRNWSLEEACRLLDLEFIANEADLVKASPGVKETHRPEDVVDLTHPNGGQVYLRKGAKRDLAVERATWERKRANAQATADHYQGLLDDPDWQPGGRFDPEVV